MYIQNQMQTALRESPSMGNIHVPQPVFGVQPTTMSYAPCMLPAYPQLFQRWVLINHHIIQPIEICTYQAYNLYNLLSFWFP